jgi:glycosyltransferase involved in cell wall biosynthesis
MQTFERAVRRQLESEEYALAHFTDPFGGYALCEMKGDYGYRLIYEAQTFPSQELRYTHPQTEGDKRFLAKIRRQELFCLMNVDRVVTGSLSTQAYIQSLGASTEQIRLLRSPVDLGPYKPEVLGVPDGEPMRLMYLGSQAGWQGLPTLLRAFSFALEKGAEARLTLVGARHPDWQPHLEDLVKDLGIQGHVEFQPPVSHDDLFKVLALADVGVIPLDDVDRNRLQGGPLAKVSEYLAAGRPVISADLPVTRELIPASAALFYPPGDASALAQCIVDLARNVPRRVELGREARAFAEVELDAGLIRGRLLDLYDELLGPRTATVGPPSALPEPTMTGTPTSRLASIVPPELHPSSQGRPSPPPIDPAKPSASPPATKPPLREELPLVVGQVLDDVDTRLIKTEPDARPGEPPVVMGLPLREQGPPSAASSSGEEPPAPTPIIRSPLGPLRREDSEESPTNIVAPPAAARRDVSPLTPTPILRSPLGPEEPPAPTPIVSMKTLATDRPAGASRPEPSPGRPPTAPAAPPVARSEPPVLRPEPPAARPEPPVLRPEPSATRSEPPVLRPEPPVVRSEPPPIRPPSPPPPAATPPAPGVSARTPPSPEPARAPPELSDRIRTPPPIPLSRATPLPGPQAPPALQKPSDAPAPRPTPPPSVSAEDEPEEIPEEEAQEISEAELAAAPTPPHSSPRLEEAEEISEDEVQEASDADAVESVDDQVEPADDLDEADADPIDEAEADPIDEAEATSLDEDEAEPIDAARPEPIQAASLPAAPADAPALAPPDSALDPWFAQLAHGYCPPEGAQFARHTPPTTFPGRDKDITDPSPAAPAPSLANGASRGKSP